ncbi:MAG: SEC-C domain-containing protein [Chloroflexota bacterium]
MLKNKTKTLIETHFAEANDKYTGLSLSIDDEGASITGALKFDATYNRVRLSDTYDVEIVVPKSYPEDPPKARETADRIPADFHTNPDGFACLTTPLEIRKQFNRQPDLIGFIDHLLIPYLFGYTHLLKYNFLPFGEFDHGYEGVNQSYAGLIEKYREAFSVDDDIEVMGLLKVISEDNYRGHHDCPCGSSLKLRDCHGPAILEIKKSQSAQYFFEEYINLLFFIYEEVDKIPKELISIRLLKLLDKVIGVS